MITLGIKVSWKCLGVILACSITTELIRSLELCGPYACNSQEW